jgi:Arc/MetJ-type ribon-helix-helix transcriptional regulator
MKTCLLFTKKRDTLNFVEAAMETQNITLSLPKSVLRRMKLLAAQRQSSVSRLLTQAVENMLAEETEYEAARKRQTKLLEKGFNLGFRKPANRDALHER